MQYDLIAHLYRQRAFSKSTFGPGVRTEGVINHIKKELIEVAEDPENVLEWVDVVLLALDGLWRCAEGQNKNLSDTVHLIELKQSINEDREWPDWRTADPDKAIEHIEPSPGVPKPEDGP